MPIDQMALKVNVDGARAFVLAQGGLREQARLLGIFGVHGPDREVVKALEGLQNPDGGYPLRQQPGAPSSLDTTCCILAQVKDMPPLAGSPMASRALAFLRRNQHHQGYWAADGDRARAYLTANATYTLLTLEPGHLDPVARGEFWLRRELGLEGNEQFTQTLGMASAIWYRLHGAGSQEVAATFDRLCRRRVEAMELAWWLSCALEVGMGGRYLLTLVRMLGELAGQQGEDGSWPSADGAAVEATLQALRVFRGYGLA